MFQTIFAVGLTNWQSSVGGNLRVNIWGVTTLSPAQQVQIGPSLQLMNSSGLNL